MFHLLQSSSECLPEATRVYWSILWICCIVLYGQCDLSQYDTGAINYVNTKAIFNKDLDWLDTGVSWFGAFLPG